MAARNPRLADLSDDDRLVLETWLVEFDEHWDEGSLASRVEQIPRSSSWRLPALAEMVKIDLERRWQHGRQVGLESYLKKFPELGSPADVSADLIQAEYEVRRQFGAPAAFEDYIKRFPQQAGELARLLAEGVSSLPHRSSAGGPQPGDQSHDLPEQFGRYRIIKRLGQGGMGSVHLAEDTQLQRRVALKVVNYGSKDGPEARKRLLAEARAAATLDHPYLCPVRDVGEIDGRLYLTMAYIEGKSLAESTHGKSLPPRQVAALVGKLAVALQEAHGKGVIHRDLKPSNVMIKATGARREPVIVDFGLARRDDANEARLTKTGQVIGTLDYMAPEQIRGELKEIGPACDIYALGVMLYELLTGRVPFEGSGLAVVGQILTQAPLPPSTFRSDLDPRLEAICLKAMAKTIGDRYASMAELAAALTDYLRSEARPTNAALPATGAGYAATQVETEADRLKGRPGQAAESRWESMTDFREADRSSKAEPEVARPGRPPWLWPSVAAGVLILGLFVAWLGGVSLPVKTPEGDLVFSDLPKQAVVTIDSKIHTVEWPGGKGAAIVTVPAGEHRVKVEVNGVEVYGQEVSIATGRTKWITVRLEPRPASGPGKDDASTAPAEVPMAPVSAPPAVSTSPPATSVQGLDPSITNSIGMKLVLIPAGEFLMGSPDSDTDAQGDEKPQHPVRITRPFYLGATEVTQGQYRAVMGQSPSHFKGSDDLPVEQVSCNDAIAFCNNLSEREKGQLGGARYRLPTEAEWEYACRGGSTTRYSFGDDAARLGEYAWYDGNSGKKTHPVGGKWPNTFNLHDMHGNVWEWCQDSYDKDYYGRSPVAEPLGPARAASRVYRGGCWYYYPQLARSAFRNGYEPGYRANFLGFRAARVQAGW